MNEYVEEVQRNIDSEVAKSPQGTLPWDNAGLNIKQDLEEFKKKYYDHVCNEICVCPIHETKMIYYPKLSEHACFDLECKFALGYERYIRDEKIHLGSEAGQDSGGS